MVLDKVETDEDMFGNHLEVGDLLLVVESGDPNMYSGFDQVTHYLGRIIEMEEYGHVSMLHYEIIDWITPKDKYNCKFTPWWDSPRTCLNTEAMKWGGQLQTKLTKCKGPNTEFNEDMV